ncbi:MAG: DedA family protein [Bacteroidia bacterium]|nr:DedA family protein [Bacteroidia bacterium]MCC6768224.1 DedA family protein [Bacteroidia bacterium]
MWHYITEFFSYFQPEFIISYGGLLLLLIVVFVENGLFFGFFLPGDSLMFTAGLLCATKVLPHTLGMVLGSVFLTAIAGSMVGYYFGFRAGPGLYSRKDSFFFRKSHLKAAEDFYERYGLRTLIIGRFLPVIRTFAPIVAGLIKMKFWRFMFGNILGAGAWVGSLVTLGYYFGIVWPDSEKYLGYIILILILITALPVIKTLAGVNKKASGK